MKNIDDNTMQYRLYNILRMNIKLAKESNTLSSTLNETFDSFEQVCKKIDHFNHEKYEAELASLCTVTTTVEEEKVRLEKLVKLISDRIEERNELVNEYQDLTFKILGGLDPVTDMNNLDVYRSRLENIREYLENNRNIVVTENELSTLNAELEKAIIQKSNDEEKNYDLEDNILLKFRNVLMSNEAYSDMTGVIDVDYELEILAPKVLEDKKTLDTFEKAFQNLKKAGISSQTEIEYSTYVEDAKETYYQTKEKEFLLRIYKLLLDSKNEYSELFSKREELDKIIKERITLRKKLELTSTDILSELYDAIDEQKILIKAEKLNIDNIKKLNDKIAFKERKLEGYKEANQKVDILAILQEYGIIETYTNSVSDEVSETFNIPVSNEDVLSFGDLDSKIEERMVVEPKDPYTIKNVSEVPKGINVSFVKNKANTVMRRVGKALGFEAPKVEVVKPKEEEPIASVEIPVVEEIVAESVQPKEEIVEEKEDSVPVFTVEPVTEILPEVKVETPKVELPKNDLVVEPMVSDIFEIKEDIMPEISLASSVVDTKEEVVKTEEPKPEATTNLFWPESKPLFPSDIKLDSSLDSKFVTMSDPFPEVKKDDEFNPQILNSTNDFTMPEIPMGNMTLSSEPGTLASPMKIRRM